MQTRLLYNYKNGDVELGERINALSLKLNLGANEDLDGKISNAVNTEKANREQADREIGERLEQMQLEIDGAISTWFEAGEPTLENAPVEDWEESDYDTHLGDLYYDTETGYCYRFMKEEGEYSWSLVRDTQVTAALANAAAAQATADAAVPKAQGVINAGHHLVIDAEGNVTAELPDAILLAGDNGTKVFAIGIGEGGALTVSEVVFSGNGGE